MFEVYPPVPRYTSQGVLDLAVISPILLIHKQRPVESDGCCLMHKWKSLIYIEYARG